MGTLPDHLANIFFSEECCNSASLTPTSGWLASSKNFHTPWVRLPTEQMKVVTMGALLKFSGLATFFFLIFSKGGGGSRFRLRPIPFLRRKSSGEEKEEKVSKGIDGA